MEYGRIYFQEDKPTILLIIIAKAMIYIVYRP